MIWWEIIDKLFGFKKLTFFHCENEKEIIETKRSFELRKNIATVIF